MTNFANHVPPGFCTPRWVPPVGMGGLGGVGTHPTHPTQASWPEGTSKIVIFAE